MIGLALAQRVADVFLDLRGFTAFTETAAMRAAAPSRQATWC